MSIKANITIDQGATYSTTISLTDPYGTPLLISGYTAAGQIKRSYTSINTVSLTATINAAASQLTLSLTANQTGSMYPGRYVYDVQVVDPQNNVTRLLEGIATVTPGVTNETLETYSNTLTYETYFTTPTVNSTPTPPYPGYLVTVTTSQALLQGSIYLVDAIGLRLTLPLPSQSTENIIIKDITGSASQNTAIVGNINGGNTVVVLGANQGIQLIPAEPALDIWIPGNIP